MYSYMHNLGFLVEKWRQTREWNLVHYARSYFAIHTPLGQCRKKTPVNR